MDNNYDDKMNENMKNNDNDDNNNESNNFSSHYHINVVKSLFTSRYDQFENLRETTVLACEMFTSGRRPWFKSIACLSSLMTITTTTTIKVTDEDNDDSNDVNIIQNNTPYSNMAAKKLLFCLQVN